MNVWWKTVVGVLDLLMRESHTIPPDVDGPFNLVDNDVEFEIEPLLRVLQGSIRKYSRISLRNALDAILNRGLTVTKASYLYGIKRTSLQHYLKKLNIKIKY